MRTPILAVTIIAGLQVFASAASATDRASAVSGSRSATEMASADSAMARTADAGQAELQASLSNAAERKMYESQAQTVAKNFASPKPVRIYFFFGGR